MKLTDTKIYVLSKLAQDGGYISDDKFISRQNKSVGGLRGTRFGRKARGLPYVTFKSLIEATYIEEIIKGYQRYYRITDVGRSALDKCTK